MVALTAVFGNVSTRVCNVRPKLYTRPASKEVSGTVGAIAIMVIGVKNRWRCHRPCRASHHAAEPLTAYF